MTGAAREKDQADYDLERVMEMFDTALTSNDERVVNALRSLLMIVALTNPEDGNKIAGTGRNRGPLRQMQDDIHNLIRSVNRLESDLQNIKFGARTEQTKHLNPWSPDPYNHRPPTTFNPYYGTRTTDNTATSTLPADFFKKINGGII